MTTHMADPGDWDEALAALSADYAGLWQIWRSGHELWCASLRHPTAGVDPTVIEDSADKLRAELEHQRQRLGSSGRPMRVIPGGRTYRGRR